MNSKVAQIEYQAANILDTQDFERAQAELNQSGAIFVHDSLLSGAKQRENSFQITNNSGRQLKLNFQTQKNQEEDEILQPSEKSLQDYNRTTPFNTKIRIGSGPEAAAMQNSLKSLQKKSLDNQTRSLEAQKIGKSFENTTNIKLLTVPAILKPLVAKATINQKKNDIAVSNMTKSKLALLSPGIEEVNLYNTVWDKIGIEQNCKDKNLYPNLNAKNYAKYNAIKDSLWQAILQQILILVALYLLPLQAAGFNSNGASYLRILLFVLLIIKDLMDTFSLFMLFRHINIDTKYHHQTNQKKITSLNCFVQLLYTISDILLIIDCNSLINWIFVAIKCFQLFQILQSYPLQAFNVLLLQNNCLIVFLKWLVSTSIVINSEICLFIACFSAQNFTTQSYSFWLREVVIGLSIFKAQDFMEPQIESSEQRIICELIISFLWLAIFSFSVSYWFEISGIRFASVDIQFQQKSEQSKAYLHRQSLPLELKLRTYQELQNLVREESLLRDQAQLAKLFESQGNASLISEFKLNACAQMLQQSEILKILSPLCKKNLLSKIKVQYYHTGQEIISKDDLPINLFFVNYGQISINFFQSSKLYSQQLFGELNFVLDKPYSYSVISATACEVFVISRQELIQLLVQYPEDRELYCLQRDSLSELGRRFFINDQFCHICQQPLIKQQAKQLPESAQNDDSQQQNQAQNDDCLCSQNITLPQEELKREIIQIYQEFERQERAPIAERVRCRTLSRAQAVKRRDQKYSAKRYNIYVKESLRTLRIELYKQAVALQQDQSESYPTLDTNTMQNINQCDDAQFYAALPEIAFSQGRACLIQRRKSPKSSNQSQHQYNSSTSRKQSASNSLNTTNNNNNNNNLHTYSPSYFSTLKTAMQPQSEVQQDQNQKGEQQYHQLNSNITERASEEDTSIKAGLHKSFTSNNRKSVDESSSFRQQSIMPSRSSFSNNQKNYQMSNVPQQQSVYRASNILNPAQDQISMSPYARSASAASARIMQNPSWVPSNDQSSSDYFSNPIAPSLINGDSQLQWQEEDNANNYQANQSNNQKLSSSPEQSQSKAQTIHGSQNILNSTEDIEVNLEFSNLMRNLNLINDQYKSAPASLSDTQSLKKNSLSSKLILGNSSAQMPDSVESQQFSGQQDVASKSGRQKTSTSISTLKSVYKATENCNIQEKMNLMHKRIKQFLHKNGQQEQSKNYEIFQILSKVSSDLKHLIRQSRQQSQDFKVSENSQSQLTSQNPPSSQPLPKNKQSFDIDAMQIYKHYNPQYNLITLVNNPTTQ